MLLFLSYYLSNLLNASFAASCSASFLELAVPFPNITSSILTIVVNVLLLAGPSSLIISYDVDNKTTYGNAIFPGDTIDLYLGTTTDDGLVLYTRFIAHIQVLAVRDEDGKDVFVDKENPSEPDIMSFAVPEYLFLLLKRAMLTGFQIEFVARNDAYTENAEPTKLVSEELESMILNKTYIVQGECKDLTVCG